MNAAGPPNPIEYSLDIDEEDDLEASCTRFDQLQFQLRRIRRTRKRRGVMLEDIDIQNVDMSYLGRRIRLKVKVDDYYFTGYQKIQNGNPGLLWEAHTDKERACLHGSNSLKFSVNYGGCMPKRRIGYGVLRNAFDTLWFHTPDKFKAKFAHTKIEEAFQTIALNICEPARLQPVFLCLMKEIGEGRDPFVPGWMQLLVNDWETYSGVAKQALPTTLRFPHDLNQQEVDNYDDYILTNILDPEITAAAPYFARKAVRVLHID